MATICSQLDVYFQDVLDNIDVELITPCLRSSNIISTKEQVKLKKKSEKSAQVKLILKKVKSLPNGDDLFKDCLKKANCSGHCKILSTVYNTDYSGK